MLINKLAKRLDNFFRHYPVRAVVLAWLCLSLIISVHDTLKGNLRRDFTRYSRAASIALFEGKDPYEKDPKRGTYKYYPLNATILWPFTKMPVPIAQGIWTATNITLLALCLWAHRRIWTVQLRVPWWVWAIAFAVALRFFVKNLRLGQWNTSVYCLSFLGLTALYRGRVWLGGQLVGLAAGLKYLPSFFLLYGALRRHWLACATMLAGYVTWVFLFPSVVLGPSRHLDLLHRFCERARDEYRAMTEPEYTSSLSLRSTVMRMTSAVKPRLPDPDVYDFTIVQLPVGVARKLATATAIVVLVLMASATLLATRRWGGWAESLGSTAPAPPTPPTNALRELCLIGAWYATFLMISPETRSPHHLTLFTAAYASAAALAKSQGAAWSRRLSALSLVAGMIMLLAPAEIAEKARYHLIASGLGCYAWGQLALWFACILAAFTAFPSVRITLSEEDASEAPGH